MKMTEALLVHEIDGALVDNYVITHSLNLIQDEPIRIERYIDHAITYGVVLASNSSKLENCFRRFLHNHPQEVFEIIAENLVPLKVRDLFGCIPFTRLSKLLSLILNWNLHTAVKKVEIARDSRVFYL